MDVDKLPKTGKKINWKNSVGKKLYFEYDDIKGYVEIMNYISPIITFKYMNKEYDMIYYNFYDVKFGEILNKKTSNFKVEIGCTFKDDKRNLNILDKKYKNKRLKYYKYKCNICGWEEGWIEESNLLKGIGCSCCSNRTIVRGINDMATTDPWMIEYLVNKEDAYKYTSRNPKKVHMLCLDCKRIKFSSIRDLNKMHYLRCTCKDGVSYSNKFMYNVLEQLKYDFISEYSPKWAKRRSYDFYDKDNNIIIEMDGGFHKKYNSLSGQTVEESKEIDNWKDEQAIKHGVKIIRIDCDYIDMEHRFECIKNSILNSELINIYDFSKINWDEVNKFAIKNLVKDVCEYYEQHKNDMMLMDIAKHFNIGANTLTRYIKQGNKFGWCEYVDGRKTMYSSWENNKSKKVRVIETGQIFESSHDCDRRSESIFGTKFNFSTISAVCRGDRKSHKGFHFEYVIEDE